MLYPLSNEGGEVFRIRVGRTGAYLGVRERPRTSDRLTLRRAPTREHTRFRHFKIESGSSAHVEYQAPITQN